MREALPSELLDHAQRERIAVTRYGRTIAYVVSEHEMRQLQAGMLRRKKAIVKELRN